LLEVKDSNHGLQHHQNGESRGVDARLTSFLRVRDSKSVNKQRTLRVDWHEGEKISAQLHENNKKFQDGKHHQVPS
jgi:hypothetical protein